MLKQKMQNGLRAVQTFWKGDSGATTVDYVVISAATLGITIGTVAALGSDLEGLAKSFTKQLSLDTITEYVASYRAQADTKSAEADAPVPLLVYEEVRLR